MKNAAAPHSIQEKAYRHLRAKILSGEIAPGAALSEVSIARELGNSRGPVREAVRRLTAEGLLRPSPTGGTVVSNFTRREVAEIYELREALEVYAAGKAAERGLEVSELDTMHGLAQEILALRDELAASGGHRLSAPGMKRFIRVDFQFHSMVLRAAANSRILKAVAGTRVLLNIFGLRRKGHDVAQLTQIHRYHSEIAAAIARRDPPQAMRLLGEHIRLSKEERLREYDDSEREVALGVEAADAFTV